MTNGTPNFDFDSMTKEWRDRMMEDWGNMAKAMVGSDSFTATSAACMDWSLFWQKQMRNQSGQFLEALELPKRSDLARLNKQIMSVEQRVVDVEERVDELSNKMDRLIRSIDKLTQRLERDQEEAEEVPVHRSQEGQHPAGPKKSTRPRRKG